LVKKVVHILKMNDIKIHDPIFEENYLDKWIIFRKHLNFQLNIVYFNIRVLINSINLSKSLKYKIIFLHL